MITRVTTFLGQRARQCFFSLLAGATAAALPDASALAASATATLNCQGETGSILAGSWKLNAAADNAEEFLANGLQVTHPGSIVDVTMTFDKNPERACFEFDLLLNDTLAGKEVADLDFAAVSEVVVSKGTFTQTYRLTLPTTLPLGEYSLTAELGSTSQSGTSRLIYSDIGGVGSMYVTWNPRQTNSPTYASDTTLGYVGASTAKLPLSDGHALSFQIEPFSPEVMKAAMQALAGTSEDQRRSPAEVYRRILTYQGNSLILWGRWDGKSADGSEALKKLSAYYDDSKKPWEWSTSTEIYKKKAKYGQSWVFACTTVSMARALGIPSRPVTNTNSVQEAGGSYKATYKPTSSPLMVTTGSAVVFSSDGMGGMVYDASKSADKIWNFHVWTEASYKTDSSGPGWNAYDGTCQEMSDGKQQCAAGSVTSILKNGYDGAFVAGESNADIVVYLRK